MAEQSGQPENQGDKADHQAQLMGKAADAGYPVCAGVGQCVA
jgi:hypothetical protein